MAPNGMVLAYLSKEAIKETFGIPHYDQMVNMTKKESSTFFEKAFGRCMSLITSDWMSRPKRPQLKLPKSLACTDFKEEYSDMVFMLNEIMGSPQRAIFDT